jgi:hypothetical protein
MSHRERRVLVISIILLLLPAAVAQNTAKQPGESSSERALQLADPVHAGVAPQDKAPAVALYNPPEGAPAPRSGTDPKTDSNPDPNTDANGPLWRAYNAAVEHVGVWRNEDVRKLKPLKVAADGTVEVATSTPYDVPSPLVRDTWVTIVPELLTICRHFTGNVALQVREVLGLPPDLEEIRDIVVMKVQPTDIFRPTPDPTPWTLCPCGNPAGNECNFDPQLQCGNRFPKDVAPSHVQWIADTTLSVRQLPRGYPWTHLGYTYNWRPGADPYGASEYIVRKGAEISDVKKFKVEDYCKPDR